MPTLYITDLDGTLLDNNAEMTPESARMISELSSRGAIISVATARTPATVETIMADTVTYPEMVVMTGAAIWDRSAGRFSDICLLPQKDVGMMLEVFDRRGIRPFCYVLNADDRFLDVYHSSATLTPAETVFVNDRARLTLKGFHLGKKVPSDQMHRVALFFGMGTRDEIISVAEELRAMSDCYISYYKDTYTPSLWLLEIFGPGVSKAAGVDRLRRRIGADRVVAFGDNLNDIPMLQAADVAVVVENALDEVKEIADVIIGPNTSDSVARFIQSDFSAREA